MFLKSYTELAVAFDDVSAALASGPYTWLQPAADAAERGGNQLLVEVGLDIRGHELGRTAWLEVTRSVATGLPTKRIALCPGSATGSNISGQTPAMTVMPFCRP